MFVRSIVLIVAMLSAWPVAASERMLRLLDLAGGAQIVEVMRLEGLAYGRDLADEMLPDGPSSGWSQTVARIYDRDTMLATLERRFAAQLADSDLDPLFAFYQGETGRRMVRLEVSARRAMIDEGIEQQARDTYADLRGTPDARLKLVREVIETNELIERNVAGAMNSSYMFYDGLVSGGALDMSRREILADVWDRQDETRRDTREWLYGFLLTAYAPLASDELRAYIALAQSDAGQALNRALFAGFDAMYAEISNALGRALAQEMRAEEL